MNIQTFNLMHSFAYANMDSGKKNIYSIRSVTNNNKLPLFQGSFPQVQCRRTLTGPLSSIVRIMRTARKSLIFLQPQAQTANNFKYTGARGTPANNTYIRRQEETASAGPYEERVRANGSTCVRCSIDSANNRFLRITINCQDFSRCCLGKEKNKTKTSPHPARL